MVFKVYFSFKAQDATGRVGGKEVKSLIPLKTSPCPFESPQDPVLNSPLRTCHTSITAYFPARLDAQLSSHLDYLTWRPQSLGQQQLV